MLCPQLAHTCTADPESRMTTSILRRRRIRQNPADMLDDPGLVNSEYTDPSRLGARMAIYGRAVEAAVAAVVETHPTRVLDVGAGTGAFSARVAAATGATVSAVDTSAVAWEIAFPDPDALRRLIAANIRRGHLSDRVAHIDLPLTATARHTIFVAEAPRGSSVARDAD
jgi:predicted RNA methylase